ncbi:MAG: hypothetical protein AB7F90_06155 [Nitrospirales bacterium]
MGLEIPLVAIILSRFPNPEIHLAAWGGVVFPLSLIIEAPIIMILSASTVLCKDGSAYVLLRNFIWVLGGMLTILHMAVAFTPLYDLIVVNLLGVPMSIVQPARVGLQIMTPWTLAIALRRFLQGLVIRTGQTRLIVLGTFVRICISGSLLGFGLWETGRAGIVVATTAMVTGVIVEAGLIHILACPAIRLVRNQTLVSGLSIRKLVSFYLPLAATPLLTLATLPIISAALSRMPMALESLAVWPVLGGLTFVFRSVGFAFQEVVIALSPKREMVIPLKYFAGGLACCTTGSLLFLAVTPLATFWFDSVAALKPDLSLLAQQGLWIALLMPLFSPWEGFFNGILVQHGLTKRVTQAVFLYGVGCSTLLGLGVFYGEWTGLYVGLLAVVFGLILQTTWLGKKSTPFLSPAPMETAVNDGKS